MASASPYKIALGLAHINGIFAFLAMGGDVSPYKMALGLAHIKLHFRFSAFGSQTERPDKMASAPSKRNPLGAFHVYTRK